MAECSSGELHVSIQSEKYGARERLGSHEGEEDDDDDGSFRDCKLKAFLRITSSIAPLQCE